MRRRGFTLMELLIVIGIIVVLAGLLFPVISGVRKAAHAASTASQLTGIRMAIESYYQDHHAYPGPLAQQQVCGGQAARINYTDAAGNPRVAPLRLAELGGAANANQLITGAENLVLGLMGGLRFNIQTGEFWFHKDDLGKGAVSLNPATPKRHKVYLSPRPDEISAAGAYFKDTAERQGTDTWIPEFIDQFESEPLPILYLRANQGAPGVTDLATMYGNGHVVQYNLDEVRGYTLSNPPTPPGQSLGISSDTYHGLRDVAPDTFAGKAMAGMDYLISSMSPAPLATEWPTGANPPKTIAKQKDSYILVSAGKDRQYGTDDDITNFGSVK
jgi:prepilin-type N-terminal cleavage/methylation domain-containing protein